MVGVYQAPIFYLDILHTDTILEIDKHWTGNSKWCEISVRGGIAT
jgi:hypothetical protein